MAQSNTISKKGSTAKVMHSNSLLVSRCCIDLFETNKVDPSQVGSSWASRDKNNTDHSDTNSVVNDEGTTRDYNNTRDRREEDASVCGV